MDKLVNEARLPDARFADDGRDLPVPVTGLLQGAPELRQLGIASDEAGEAASSARLQAGPDRARPRRLVDLDWIDEVLDRNGAERFHLDVAFGESERGLGEPDRSWGGELLHAGGQVGRLAHSGVIHAEVASDGANDDLARVDAHADLHLDAVGAARVLGVSADRVLHPECGIGRADGVVLVGHRRAEQRHDPVTHELVHRPFEPVYRLHHQLKDGVEELAGVLRVTVSEKLHRALEVGEEDGHLLALAFESGLRG
jgi:hypothetical protein